MRAWTSPDDSATPAPTMATIMSPTALKPMKFGMSEVYMKRTPSVVSRLLTAMVWSWYVFWSLPFFSLLLR
jgi:hypothetical protein